MIGKIIGKIIGFLFMIGMGLFAVCSFIVANECDKYYGFDNEDK